MTRRLPFAPGTMLAPMEGVTNPVFRRLTAERGGVGILCTEFVRITTNPICPERLSKEVAKAPGTPLSVQVMGKEIDRMSEAAAVVSAHGADVVDINLGCPSPNAVRGGVGSAMLKDEKLLTEVVSAMRQNVPGVLSAKMRAGFDTGEHAVAIARTLAACGVDYVVVHPRRRCDLYLGTADWRVIRGIREALTIPVIGNGDCWYASDVLRMERETGCAGVMLGRSALRNPWLFEQVADLRSGREPRVPTGRDLLEHMRQIATVYRAEFPLPKQHMGRYKELVTYWGRGVSDEGRFRRDALRAQSLDAILEVAERHLSTLPDTALDLCAVSTVGMERSGACA